MQDGYLPGGKETKKEGRLDLLDGEIKQNKTLEMFRFGIDACGMYVVGVGGGDNNGQQVRKQRTKKRWRNASSSLCTGCADDGIHK